MAGGCINYTSNMSVSIVTFADLGERKNLKTPDILPVIDKFAKENKLDQIICRRSKNFYFPETFSTMAPPIFFAVKVFGRLLKILFSVRELEWFLIDNYAKRNLKKSDITLFHPALFKRAIGKARKNASITVGIATVDHPTFTRRLIKEEGVLLGISFHNSRAGKQNNPEVVGSFDYVIAFSDFVKNSYVESGFSPEKIFVAYSDIDINKFKSQGRKKNGKFKVLYVAHTTLLKGLHYLLDAWEDLNLKNAELLLVGGYGNIPKQIREKYNKQIKRNPTIKWIGFTKDVLKYYQETSIFVLPSLTEGGPKVVMEAMACGVPVITTENAKSIVEDGKTGFVVPIRDSKAIKEKIEFLYNNPDVAEKMGKEARRAMENKKPFGDVVFEIYKEILRQEGIEK